MMVGISIHTHTQILIQLSVCNGTLSLSQATGAAPLPRAVAEFFAQFDITLCQMYGMSETTGTACMNSPSE